MSTLVYTANLKPSILVCSQDTKLIIPIPAMVSTRKCSASLQVIELLHIHVYPTSMFSFFSGRKMPTLANKAIPIIKLGIIPDIPANDGLNTEVIYDSDIFASLQVREVLHI